MIQAIITYMIVFSAVAYTLYKTVKLFMPQKDAGICGCGGGGACPKGELLANVKAQKAGNSGKDNVQVKAWSG